eukprot:1259651-Pleurochrysis_carterae.AAC.1
MPGAHHNGAHKMARSCGPPCQREREFTPSRTHSRCRFFPASFLFSLALSVSQALHALSRPCMLCSRVLDCSHGCDSTPRAQTTSKVVGL